MEAFNVNNLVCCDRFFPSRFINEESHSLITCATLDSVVPITRDWLKWGAHFWLYRLTLDQVGTIQRSQSSVTL